DDRSGARQRHRGPAGERLQPDPRRRPYGPGPEASGSPLGPRDGRTGRAGSALRARQSARAPALTGEPQLGALRGRSDGGRRRPRRRDDTKTGLARPCRPVVTDVPEAAKAAASTVVAARRPGIIEVMTVW